MGQQNAPSLPIPAYQKIPNAHYIQEDDKVRGYAKGSVTHPLKKVHYKWNKDRISLQLEHTLSFARVAQTKWKLYMRNMPKIHLSIPKNTVLRTKISSRNFFGMDGEAKQIL